MEPDDRFDPSASADSRGFRRRRGLKYLNNWYSTFIRATYLVCDIMAIRNALCELGRVLEDWDAGGGAIEAVRLVDCANLAADGPVTATVELQVATAAADGERDGPTLSSPGVGTDGSLRATLAVPEPVVAAAESEPRVEPTDARFNPDGTVTFQLSITIPDGIGDVAVPADATNPTPSRDGRANVEDAEHERTGERAGGDRNRSAVPADSERNRSAGSADRDVPPFEDRELLRRVYASCDTFAEMADAIEMDVTAETVRRYMIDHDIHEPNSYDTGDSDEPAEKGAGGAPTSGDPVDETADAGVDEPKRGVENGRYDPSDGEDGTVVLSDGIGLPESITVDALIDTIRRSNTIYEVKRDIDVDHDDALELLRELNLLDLVVGRLATEGERDVSRDEIVGRLREASAVEPLRG